MDVVAALRAAGCVYAEDEAALLLADGRPVADLVARRVSGEPLEQVLGWAAFRGLRITLAPGVFVPRRRTELLAACAIGALPPGGVAVELCCGAAPVAAAIATEVPGARVHAADIDPVAVRCARRNVGSVFEGDLFAALPGSLRGTVDVLVANTPYVPSEEVSRLPREARDHEPSYTLDGGADGLDLLRRIAAEAPSWLAPGGLVFVEVSDRQLPEALAAYQQAGLTGWTERDEDLDATVAAGRLP